jgi:hypothetical protein
MPLNILALGILACTFMISPVQATTQDNVPSYIQKNIPDASPVGSGRLRYMFWDVYDATLFAPQGDFKKDKPFALSLKYLRPLEGRDIADTSAEEIRRQGNVSEIKIAAWHEQMVKIFPSVNTNSVITGLYLPGKGTLFFANGKAAGSIMDDEFSRAFFNIWLGPKTRAPELRRSLTGA